MGLYSWIRSGVRPGGAERLYGLSIRCPGRLDHNSRYPAILYGGEFPVGVPLLGMEKAAAPYLPLNSHIAPDADSQRKTTSVLAKAEVLAESEVDVWSGSDRPLIGVPAQNPRWGTDRAGCAAGHCRSAFRFLSAMRGRDSQAQSCVRSDSILSMGWF